MRALGILTLAFVLAVPLAGCSDGRSSDALVTRTDPEPAGAHCPLGGRAVKSGLDSNGNGALDDTEVAVVTFACDAAPEALLVRSESAEGHCANGGVAFLAGLDANGDGSLQDSEVARVSYDCAQAPPAPPSVLSRTAAAAADTVCLAGGTKVESGYDSNGNGTLDDGEVRRSTVVCGAGPAKTRTTWKFIAECRGYGSLVETGLDEDLSGALEDDEVAARFTLCDGSVLGAYRVQSADDLTLLAKATQVSGDVVIEGSTLEDCYLGSNLTITGSLVIRNNPALRRANFSARLEGNLEVTDNPLLTSFSGWYGEVGGSVRIENNAVLSSLFYSGPASIGRDLVIRGNPSLVFSGGDRLSNVAGSVRILENAKLAYLQFDHLLTIGGDLEIARNSALESVDGRAFPLLDRVAGKLIVSGNAALYLTSLPSVQSLGGIEISDSEKQVGLSFGRLSKLQGDFVVTRCRYMPRLSLIVGSPVERIEGSLLVHNNPEMTSFGPGTGLAQVREIGGRFAIVDNPNLAQIGTMEGPFLGTGLRLAGEVRIARNAALTTLEPANGASGAFPVLLAVGTLSIEANPLLEHLWFPALTACFDRMEILDNPLLPTCEAQALKTSAPAAWWNIVGNDDAAVCP